MDQTFQRRREQTNMNIPEQLLSDYYEGDVCLFVGAGVSKGCGLPDWKELARGGREISEKTRTVSRSICSCHYARSAADIDVCSLVRQCLYARSIELSKAVLEIPLLDKVKRICCFNYDDVL